MAGGFVARRWDARQAIRGYIAVEAFVAAAAIGLPFEIGAAMPWLRWAYRTDSLALLQTVQWVLCAAIIALPAFVLGAAFPLIVRAASGNAANERGSIQLYAFNTVGATLGAVLAGFVALPSIGMRATAGAGVVVSGLAIACALAAVRRIDDHSTPDARTPAGERTHHLSSTLLPWAVPKWLAPAVLALSGFATLMYEVVWTRTAALLTGPTTFAFAATLAAVIGGLALGSFVSVRPGRSTQRPDLWLITALLAGALATGVTGQLAGGSVPRFIADRLARTDGTYGELLVPHLILMVLLVLPTAIPLGAIFPLTIELTGRSPATSGSRVSLLYGVNTLAGVAGSLVGGIFLVPRLGLDRALTMSSVLLLAATACVLLGTRTRRTRAAALVPVLLALILWVAHEPWDRALLASGIYKYGSAAGSSEGIELLRRAGSLLYYRDGPYATIAVKEIAGIRSISIDGKVDASNGSDMLVQKMLAHVPLLLHPGARQVAVIGLGSGVTAASALAHPVERVDVVEISPEVVVASQLFDADNHSALRDPRAHLIVGDGRTHLLLSTRRYDVIVSEPSNPWMAGTAALFTREFLQAARARLAAGGVICQWAHTYDISDADLRSIAATFVSVFPDGAIWLIGSDVLFVASDGPLEPRFAAVELAWQRRRVADDLANVSATGPFALWSTFIGGPDELREYGHNAVVQSDDRLALEFSGPYALRSKMTSGNVEALRKLLTPEHTPALVRDALARAGAPEWRDRGRMMLGAGDYSTAFDDFARAVRRDTTDTAALDGLVRSAVAAHRESDAIEMLTGSARRSEGGSQLLIALSRLFAATGSLDRAIAAARDACRAAPKNAAGFEQLASLFADTGDRERLGPAVQALQLLEPDGAATAYYAAYASFLKGKFADAILSAEMALARRPRYAAAQNLLGASYASLGRVDAARVAFRQALALDPHDTAIYTNFGTLELASNKRAVAASYFAQALLLDPASTSARQGFLNSQ
jgi:spermidine synthase